MIDLHSHTFLSDGELGPAELVRRVEVRGFRAIGLADHVDNATVELIVPLLARAARELSRPGSLRVLAGCEITHCRPEHIGQVARRARELGAQFIICHGETLVEPVIGGTNRAAIEAGVSILAHPGLISEDDVREAARRGVALEISGRQGHCLTNGHLAALARLARARLVFGSDMHGTDDIFDRPTAERVLRGAGLAPQEVAAAFGNAEQLVDAASA